MMSKEELNKTIFQLMIIEEYGSSLIYKQRAAKLIKGIEIYLKNKRGK